MQKRLLYVCFFSLLLIQPSCKKEEKAVVDCFGESLLIGLRGSADASNAKKYTFQIHYTGTNEVVAVNWTFGDGSTNSGAALSIDHVYSTTGTFTVKASVTTKHSSGSCTAEPTRTITIN